MDLSRFSARFDPACVESKSFDDPSDVLLFVHIPKTAGMSVGKALRPAFDKFHGVNWRNVDVSFRNHTQQALYMRTCGNLRQVIMGHYSWAQIAIWKQHDLPIKCATIMRDPVARVVSNYNYNCSSAHPANAAFRNKFPTMMDYARALPNDAQLTQMIGLFYSFEQAIEKVISYYSFIGVAENLGASLQHLSCSHSLPALQEFRVNAAGKNSAQAEIDPDVVDLVAGKSRNDLRLHQLLMNFYCP